MVVDVLPGTGAQFTFLEGNELLSRREVKGKRHWDEVGEG